MEFSFSQRGRRGLAVALSALMASVMWPTTSVAGPGTGCVLPTVDDQCEAWVSVDRTTGKSTASGYPSFLNEQLLGMSPDGETVYVTGMDMERKLITAAYSAATGAPLWTRRYEGTTSFRRATPHSLVVSPTGDTVYVVGIVEESIGMCGHSNIFYANNHGTSVVLAYDAATGDARWIGASDPDAPAETLATCALSSAISPDGSTIYTTGWRYEQRSGEVVIEALVTALDASSGDPVWRETFSCMDPLPRAPLG